MLQIKMPYEQSASAGQNGNRYLQPDTEPAALIQLYVKDATHQYRE